MKAALRPARPEAVVCVGQAGINALATIRALGRRGIPVHAVSLRSSPQFASASRFCATRTEVEDLDHLGRALLRQGARQRTRAILYVDNDSIMRTLAPHAEALAPHYHLVDPIGDALRLTDKASQMELARRCGIPVPRSWFPQTWAELAALSGETGKCLIAKPIPDVAAREADAPFKAIVAANADALALELRARLPSPAGLVIQEYIEGDDSEVYAGWCYRAESGACHVLSARKLRQTPPGAGVMAVGEPCDVPQVRDMTAQLAVALGMRGVLCTEFKRDRATGGFYFIEWNPRPDGFQSLGWRCGFDLAWIAYCDHAGLPAPRSTVRYDSGHCWINGGCDLTNLLKNPSCALRARTWLPYLREKEWAVLSRDDLAPWVKASAQFAGWLAGRFLHVLAKRAPHFTRSGKTPARAGG